MQLNEILHSIQEAIIIPLILLIGKIIIDFAREKLTEWKEARQDERIAKYIDLLADTIEICVTATNQTYVNELKEKNMFNAEAQKVAFQKTYEAVMKTLNSEAKKYLDMAYADLDEAVRQQIESKVGENRLDTQIY